MAENEQPQVNMSGRLALSYISGGLKRKLRSLQDEIIRMERFGKESITSINEFTPRTLNEVREDYGRTLGDLTAIDALRDKAQEADMRAFVDSIRSRRS